MLSMEVEEVLGCPTETIHWTDPRAFYYPHKQNNMSNNSNSNCEINVNCEDNSEKSPLPRVMDVIFIPGNPGPVVFYLDFLQQLQGLCRDALPGCEVNMHALSHANHHLKPAAWAAKQDVSYQNFNNESNEDSSNNSTDSTQAEGGSNGDSSNSNHTSNNNNNSSSKSSDSSDRCQLPPEEANGSGFDKFGLEFQSLHTLEFICKIMDRPDRLNRPRRILLIGHSIGAFIAIDAIQRLTLTYCHSTANIDPALLARADEVRRRLAGVVMLMPFIFWRNMPLYHKAMLQTFNALGPISRGAVKIASSAFISRSVETKKTTIRRMAGIKDETLAHMVADQLLTKRLIANFLSMGQDEVREVPLRQHEMLLSLQALDSAQVPLCFVYTDNDVWAPSEDMSTLKATMKHNQEHIYYAPGVTHAFTMKEGGTEKVLQLLASFFIKQSLISRL